MAGPAYSTRFFDLPGVFGGTYDAYLVPTDRLAVVKCITITYGDVTLTGLDAGVKFPSGAYAVRVVWQNPILNPTQNFGGTSRWWGTWVFNPGEWMRVAVANTVDFHASGYLLTLP